MYKLLFVFLLMLTACNSDSSKLLKGEQMFVEHLLKSRDLKTGNHLVFVLNQSSCQPCEDKVKDFYSSDKWGNVSKLFVVPTDREPIADEKDNFIKIEYKELASYGLARANGVVLFVKNGECILLESIDVNHIPKLEEKIEKLLH